MDIIKKRLEEIEARWKSSTQGKWFGELGELWMEPIGAQFAWLASDTPHMQGYEGSDQSHLDASFLANAHQDVPALVAMLEVALEGLEEYAASTYATSDTLTASVALERIAAIAAGEGTE